MALPPEGIVSVPGFFFIIGEVVIGLAIGFVLQMGLAAALLAGEVISNAMGLGFASMVDPLSGASSSAIGQFLSLMAPALFLAAAGHQTGRASCRENVGQYVLIPVGALPL